MSLAETILGAEKSDLSCVVLGTNRGLCTEHERIALSGSPRARALPGTHDPMGYPVDSGLKAPLA